MPVATATITSAWTPPPVITGFSGTADEAESFILLNWDASTLADVDFNHYTLYRRIVGETLWTPVMEITNKTTNMYEDNMAGQTTQYEYIITQFKGVVGDVPLESDESEIVTIALVTDAWFVVANDAGMYHALEVNVTDEDHTSVIQQEVFEPIASIRKRVVRGNVMGDEGQFTSLFDTSLVAAARLHFMLINDNKGPHILKSPFGDVWMVEFDAPSFRYRPGGHLEIKIGWVEI